MRTADRPIDRTRGFTLLEVMAAMMIFMFGVVGVLALFAGGLALHRDATQRAVVAHASGVVKEQVERILIDLGDVAPDEELQKPTDVPIAEFPGYFYSVEKLDVDPDVGIDGGALATVHVYTVDVGKKKGERFTLFVRPRADPELLIRRARSGTPKAANRDRNTDESGD